jgi:hypothetical protein
MVTQIMVSECAGQPTMEATGPGIVLPKRHIAVPTTDVISYAFSEYGAYDVDKPVRSRPCNKLRDLQLQTCFC